MAVARPRTRPRPVVVRDPGQLALQELEQAREKLTLDEDHEAYVRELARLFRFYLRHRLRSPEAQWTLAECGHKAVAKLNQLPSPRLRRGDPPPRPPGRRGRAGWGTQRRRRHPSARRLPEARRAVDRVRVDVRDHVPLVLLHVVHVEQDLARG